MINVTEEIYRQLAEQLMEEVENLDSDFYNSTIEIDSEELYAELKCSLIIIRNDNCQSDRCGRGCSSCLDKGRGEVTGVSPVWWEFALYTAEGEQLNSFSWREFETYINPYMSCS